MRVERVKPMVFRLTLHAYELAAVMAAARWAAEGAPGQLDESAVEQLRKVVASFDDERRRNTAGAAP